LSAEEFILHAIELLGVELDELHLAFPENLG